MFGRRNKQQADAAAAPQMTIQQPMEQKPMISLADLAAPVKGPQTFLPAPAESITPATTAEAAENSASMQQPDAFTSMPNGSLTLPEQKPITKRKSVRRIFRRKKSEPIAAPETDATIGGSVDNKPVISLADLAKPYSGAPTFVGNGEDDRQHSPLSINAPVMIDYQAPGGDIPPEAPAETGGDDRSSDGGRSVNTVVSATRSLVRTLSKIRLRGPSHANDETKTAADGELPLSPQPPSTPPPSNTQLTIDNGAAVDTSPRKRSVLRPLLPKRKSAEEIADPVAVETPAVPPQPVITLADLARPYSASNNATMTQDSSIVDTMQPSTMTVDTSASNFMMAAVDTTIAPLPTQQTESAPTEEGKKWSRMLRAPSILKRNKSTGDSTNNMMAGSEDALSSPAADAGAGHNRWSIFHRSQHNWFHKEKPVESTDATVTDSTVSSAAQPIITLADLAAPYKGPQEFLPAPEVTTDTKSDTAPSSAVSFSMTEPTIQNYAPAPDGISSSSSNVTTASESNKLGSDFLSPTTRTRWSLNQENPSRLEAINETPFDTSSPAALTPEKSPQKDQRKSLFKRAFGGKDAGAEQVSADDMNTGSVQGNSIFPYSSSAPMNFGDVSMMPTNSTSMAPLSDGFTASVGDDSQLETASNESKGSLIRTLSMANPLYRRKMRLEEERLEDERLRAEDAARYTDMRETVTTLAQQLDKLKTSMNVKMEEKEAKIEELTNKNSTLRRESESLQSNYQQVMQQCQYMQQQYAMLQQNTAQQTQVLSGDKQAAMVMVQQLQSELAASKASRDELEQRIRTLQSQVDDGNKKLQASGELVKEKEMIIEQLQGTGRQLELEFRQLDNQKRDLTNSLSEEQRKNNDLSDRAYTYQTEAKQLKATNENMLMEYNNMRQQYFQLQQQATQRVQQMGQQYQQLESTSMQQQQQLQQQLQNMEQSKQQLEREMQSLKAAGISNAADVTAMKSQLQQEIEAMKSQHQEDAAKAQELITAKEDAEKQLTDISDKLSKKDLECLQLTSQLNNKTTDAAYHEKEAKRLKNEIQNVHKAEASAAIKAKTEAEAKLNDAHQQLIKTQEQLKQQWDYAQQQYKMLEEKLVKQQADHQQELEKLQQQNQQPAT